MNNTKRFKGADWDKSMYYRQRSKTWRDANTGGIYHDSEPRGATGKVGEIEVRQEHVYARDESLGRGRRGKILVWRPVKGYRTKTGKLIRPHKSRRNRRL